MTQLFEGGLGHNDENYVPLTLNRSRFGGAQTVLLRKRNIPSQHHGQEIQNESL
ncbi:hypothetical protein [Burkholderia guangdongensis]|uniref:hypothetical protein n=1 Tax=Burkholderia guangdongensis TaxID=1792500 RepID=UPI0015C71F5A|nr:hypothetical protein [Burkholderia guangdongensis]